MQKPGDKPAIDSEYERYWHDSFPMGAFSREPLACYFETKKVLPVCPALESIRHNAEAYINLGRSRTVLFVALYEESDVCEEEKIEAFLLAPGTSVVINQKVWHFAPIPVDEDNLFLLMLGRKNIILNKDGSAEVDPDEIAVHELKQKVSVNI